MSYGPYPARVVEWHDGDTCRLDIDLGFGIFLYGRDLDGKPWLSCRIAGINAPELSTDAGKLARDFAETLCPPATRVTVLSLGWDKYGGRFDGKITLPNGEDFAQLMLQADHAVPLKT